MNRPFTSADSGKYFRFVGAASKFTGRIGQLEGFPLADPGSALPGEGILWFGPEDDRDGWDYVSPAEVEPVEESSLRYRLTRRGYFWNGVGWSVSPRDALVFGDWAAAVAEADRLDAKVEVP